MTSAIAACLLTNRRRDGASVVRVARRHAVNANQVFYWRKKYRPNPQ